MADVSLDDLIKKDKEKDRVNRLKQVSMSSFRNSSLKNSLIAPGMPIIKMRRIGSPEVISLASIDLSKNALTNRTITAGLTGVREMFNNKSGKGLSKDLRRSKKQDSLKKSFSAQLESWV